MRFLFFFLFVVLISVAFVAAVLYYIVRAFAAMSTAVKPGTKAWDTSVSGLRQQLAERAQQLTPWEEDTLQLLSVNKLQEKKASLLSTAETGVIGSIYQEPVVAYATKGQGKNTLAVARTSDREYVYRRKDRETEIWMNGQPLGVLVDGSLLAPGRSSKLLAQVQENQEESAFPVLLNNQTTVTISNPDKVRGTTPNPRALSLLRNVSPEEENVVLALTLLQVLKDK